MPNILNDSLTSARMVWNRETAPWLDCLGSGGTETLTGWSGRASVVGGRSWRAEEESNAYESEQLGFCRRCSCR